MKKVFQVFLICVMVALAYVLITITQPVTNSMAQSVNATISASSNLSNYPGTQEVILGWPFWLWFVPGSVGVAATVIVLVRKD